jgi:hypothetical protein
VDARAWDTNSMKRLSGKGAAPGGGVIIDASGRRYEFAPKPASLQDRAAKAFSRASLPKLPDLSPAAAFPGSRRVRAAVLLILSLLATFALILWARRFRP